MSPSEAVLRFRPMLDFIARHEGTANQPGEGYNTSLGYGRFTGGEKNLTRMTLDDINSLQIRMLKHPQNHFNSSALGRYQIVRRTLLDLRKQLNLSGYQKFTSDLQDELGAALIQRRGRNPKGLRAEWASLVHATNADILAAFDKVGVEDDVSAEDVLADADTEVHFEDLDKDRASGEDNAMSIQSKIRSYKVVRMSNDQLDVLEAQLNQFAEEGFGLINIITGKSDILLILESESHSTQDEERDDIISPEIMAELADKPEDFVAGVTSAASGGFNKDEFKIFFEEIKLKHFTFHEFLVLGGQHFSGIGKGKNTYPPKELWNNIVPTAKIIDMLRDDLGAPINTISIYRSPDYNACIPGAASGSVHMQFRAVDFKCSDGRGPVHWAKRLKAMRDAGEFKGGIGVYNTFVHVDTRGTNANFGPLRHKVFG